jgi:hypothetical protein
MKAINIILLIKIIYKKMEIFQLICILLSINLSLLNINAYHLDHFKNNAFINYERENRSKNTSNIPIVIFGGMGAKCRSKEYKNLIKLFK